MGLSRDGAERLWNTQTANERGAEGEGDKELRDRREKSEELPRAETERELKENK